MILALPAAVAIACGLALAWRRRDLPVLDRILLAVTPLGFAVLVAEMLPVLAQVLDDDMSASRTIPGLALARGFPIYAGLEGGPIIDFMYGPVAAMAFVPVALATTPSGVLALGALVNLVVFYGPMLWCHGGRGVPARLVATAAVVFGFLVMRDPGLEFSALSIHADAPALGLSALACAPFVRRTGMPGPRALGASALCAVLAVWAKQTSVPVLAAIPLWLLVTAGRRTALAYVAWLAGSGAVVSLVMVAAFGVEAPWFNMVTLLSRMPWYGEAEHGKLGAALGSFAVLMGQARWTLLLVVVLVASSARGAGGAGAWLRAQPWALLVLVGALEMPMAVVGGAKVGGYLNTHSVTNYFLAGAVTCGLVRLAADGRGLPRVLLLALLLGLAGWWLANPAARAQVAPTVARLRAWRTNPQEQAYAFARAHPGAVHLPWNPLASFLADGRLWNNEIGVWNRDLAGIALPDAQYRRWLPPDARWLAFRPPRGVFAMFLPLPTGRLPEYAVPVEVAGLEGWIVYERAAP